MQYNKNKFLIIITALAILAMAASAQAATWDSTTVFHATSVTKYDVAVGNKLKGASDDTVRILTTQSASPYYVMLSTDRSMALPMAWVTENVWTNTVAMRGCAIGDVDNDGQNEIIVGNTATPYGLKMIKWSGSAWVATTVLTTTNSYVGAIYDIAIGDADNNSGTPNDIIFNNSSYGVMKARWNGATFDTTRLLYNSSTLGSVYGVAMGDFDQTYAGNEIVAVTYNQYIYRIRWTGAAWDATQIYYTATDYDFYDVAVGNFDASNPGDEIAISNGYPSATSGVWELYGSGATWTMRMLFTPGNWSSNGEVAVGDFYSGNPGAEIAAVSGSGSAYEARVIYGSGTTWNNEKIMGTVSYAYGVAIGNVNRYRAGNELAVGGNYKVWEAQEYIPVANDMATMSIDNPLAGSALIGGNSVGITATVKNMGTATQNQVPVNLLITDGVSYTYTDVESTGTLVQNATQSIIFAPNWTVPNAFANYTITVTTALTGDQNASNDAKSVSVSGYKTGYTVEDFSGTTFPPDGWTAYNFDGGDPWVRYTTFYHSSPACAEIYYDVPNNDWLITPRLNVQSGDLLNFWWRTQSTSYSETLFVRVSTSSNFADTGSYSVVDFVWHTGDASWFNKQISLSAFAGQKIFIAFYYRANNTFGMAIDDVVLPPRYYPTNDLAVTSLFEPPVVGHMYKAGVPDSIGMVIKNNGTATQSNFYVQYDLVFDEGRDSVLHTASLAWLATDTIYAHWTPEHVGVDTISGWTALPGDEAPGNDMSKLTVNISTAGLVFSEDFSGTTFPPTGWTVYNFDGGDAWIRYTSFYHSAPACAEILYDVPNNDWLITPRLNVQSGNMLSFWWRTYSTSYTETLFVRVSTSPTVSDTGSYSIIAMVTSTGNISWFKKVIDLSSYAGQSIYVAFWYRCNDFYGMAIDDVQLYTPGPSIAINPPDSLVIPMNTDQILDVSLFISNIGGGTLTFSMTENPAAPWITETPSSGSVLGASTDTIDLHLNATGYGIGAYRTVLAITSNTETKATDYYPITMKIGGPIMAIAPESLHVGLCPPASHEDLLVQTNTGNEPLEIYGATVVQTTPKEVHFYMGTPLREEPATGKDAGISSMVRDSKRKMTFKSGGPDIFGHVWIDSDDPGGPTFSWIDISGTGTSITGLGDDTNLGPFPIGFNFNFYGNVYNSIQVCSNGWFSFTSTATSYTDYPLPSASAPENLLAIFWDDMNFSLGGSAYYQTIGDKFILEYKDAPRYSYGYLYTYEMILDKTCGTITYQYLSMQPGMLNSATIGIQNALKNDGLTVAYDEDYVHDSLAIRFQTNPLWVSLDPCNLKDTLAPGESDTLKVKFDSSPYTSGNFRGEVRFSCNQPGHSTRVVPVAMDILTPSLAVSPTSIIDTCQEGGTVQNAITVTNSGNCPLNFSIGAGCAWVSVLPTGGTLNPGQNMNVVVTQDCSNLYSGNYMCELRISSDDPAQQPYKVVNIYKHVGPDPNIVVSPDSFYVEVYAGLTKDTSMNISNTGDGHLMYAIATQDFTPPKAGTPLLTEGFEGTWPPSGWSIIQNNYDVTYYNCWWSQLSVYAHTGTYSAGLWWDYYDQNEWLITPQFNVPGACTLSFWTYGYEGSTYGDHYYVKASTDGGSNWDVLFDLSTLPPNGWNYYDHPYKIALDAYGGKSVKLAWHAYAIGGLYWAWLIDDVSVMSYAAPWLTVGPPTNGVVNPHANTGIPVHFSSAGVTANDKYAHIFIASNDPDQSMTAVRAHMKIIGPNYSVAPPETLVINAQEGQFTNGYLQFGNIGGRGPLICKVSDPVGWLAEYPDSFMVPIGSTFDDSIRVDGNMLIAGDYFTKVFIQTNDVNALHDTVVVLVHVGPLPVIQVAPDSFRVVVPGGSTKDTTMTIHNNGSGHLGFTIQTQETGPKLVTGGGFGILQGNKLESTQPAFVPATGTEYARARLSASAFGGPSLVSGGNPSGNPVKAKGDTVYMQLPTDPSGSWSAATSDAGAGYKLYENFWGLTKPIASIGWWGLPMIYSGGWLQGDPANLVFDITFYSDPPGVHALPTHPVCTYTNVVPTYVPAQAYSGYQAYLFSGVSLNPLCNLSEGWVSIQSKSAGSGYDWFLWMSATSGDGYSYQEGSGDYLYDDAFFLIGGQNWLTLSPTADTLNPNSSQDVNVRFDATNIMGGDKYSNIIISSNDPAHNPVTVRAHMIVAGAQYSIHPQELHITVQEGQVATDNLSVMNPGGLGTLSYKMTWAAPWLTANPDTDDVPPDGSKDVTVRVDGNQLIAGSYYAEIWVKTNAANQQRDTIPVYVHVGPDPDIQVAPMSLAVPVIPGCNRQETLKLNNQGQGHLRFETTIETAGPKLAGSTQGTNQEKLLSGVRKMNEAASLMQSKGTDLALKSAPQVMRSPSLAPGAFVSESGKGNRDTLITEGFEVSVPPTGWNVIQGSCTAGGTAPCYWSQDCSGYYMHSGNCGALVGWGYSLNTWLITPPLTLGGTSALSFWWEASYYWQVSPYDNGDLFVKISTDNGATWQTLWTFGDSADVVNSGGPWPWTSWIMYQAYLDLSAYTGDVLIAFNVVANDNADLAIDDVMLESFPVQCPFTVAPVTDTINPTSFENLIVTFDGSAFDPCSLDTLRCNLILTSNDPDEPTVTVPITVWAGRGDVFVPTCLIDIGDVVYLVNYVLKNGPAPSPICMGDCDPSHDGVIDMADLVYLIQYLFLEGLPPQVMPVRIQPGTIK